MYIQMCIYIYYMYVYTDVYIYILQNIMLNVKPWGGFVVKIFWEAMAYQPTPFIKFRDIPSQKNVGRIRVNVDYGTYVYICKFSDMCCHLQLSGARAADL